MIDGSEVLARANLWAAALRERGLVDEAAAIRLNETLAESDGERLDSKDYPLLVVMLCGPTATGKSSLINALAGAEISRRGLGATTGAAVLYVHEEDDPGRLFEYGQALGRIAQQETTVVRHRRGELLHKVLVDTPDIDSVMMQHEAMTASLVHAADLVLFVTTPEKYKVLRSARWILEQRQQRAMAFVLNKWDREALGLQRDRRHEIESDFRQVLAQEGYLDALVFKTSALLQNSERSGGQDAENELPALAAWLETGITHSTAAIIQQRRLRAAWGRLAFAIEPGVPRPLSGHPALPELAEGLACCGGTAAERVSAEASLLALPGLEDGSWPATPGLLGISTRLRQNIAATAASMRAGFSGFGFTSRAGNRTEAHLPLIGDAFGATTAATLSEKVLDLASEASAARLPLGPLVAAWTAETRSLQGQLAVLPLDVVTSVTADAHRWSLRRGAGIASMYAVEALIAVVLLMAVERLGLAFVAGSDAPGGLLTTALELIFSLLIIGHIAAAMFFPPLRQRVRRQVAERATTLIRTVVTRLRNALQDHVEAGDRLAAEGRDLLLQIDGIMATLTSEASGGEEVDRLFGVKPRPPRLDGPAPGQPAGETARAQRRPTFD